MIWTDATLSTLAAQAEETVAMELACITSRISLRAELGQPIVNLPDYVIDIASVTWKGYPLDPFPISMYVESGSGATSISSGKPRYYLYSGYGARALKLLPAPNETLAVAVNPLTTKTEIALRLIIECKRMPDVTGTSHRLPAYYRRRLIKDYVCSRAFRQESNGQNLAAADYYKGKYELTLNLVKQIHRGLFVSKRYEMQPQSETFGRSMPGRPVLPANFGVNL